MKKTEKIELRVSPEEKEALSNAARSQGRTASDVLRDHVSRYVEAAANASASIKEKKMSWISKVAYVALGAAVSIPATMFAYADDGPEPIGFDVEIKLYGKVELGEIGQTGSLIASSTTRLPLASEEPIILSGMSGAGKSYDVMIEKIETSDGVYTIAFDICRENGSECKPVARPSVMTAFGGKAELRAGVDAGEESVGYDIEIISRYQ